MKEETRYRKLEQMYLAAPCNEYYLPEISISRAAAEIVIPIRKEFFHTGGAVHGSVYFKALDDAAFFAVNSLVTDVLMVTAGFNIFLTRPIREGIIRSKGNVVHVSKRLYLADAVAYDSKDRVIARGSGSFMKSPRKLSSDTGYV